MSNILIFNNIHKKGIISLAFSETSKYLVSLGQDDYHSITLFCSNSLNWKDGHITCSTSISSSTLLWILIAETNDYPVIVGGVNTIYFLRKSGKTMEKIKGEFGKKKKIQSLLCAVVGFKILEEGCCDIFTGTTNGLVYQWSSIKHTIIATFTCHNQPIITLIRFKYGFITSSKDGLVKCWNRSWENIHTYDTTILQPKPMLKICHSLAINYNCTKLAIGMQSGEVYGEFLFCNFYK